ncbi:MAG: ATP-binding protein, partial [Chloroflexi bacterium]|nr:ATP-binding protein [Chloroflexota bacterium]
MPDFFTLVGPPYYLGLPTDWMAWAGWLALLAAVVWGVHQFWEKYPQPTRKEWLILGGFFLAALIASLFIGIRLPATGALPPPGRPEEPRGPLLMFFIAFPWMLASGFLGMLPAVVLAGFAGLVSGYTDTHSLYTSLEMAALALLFSAAIRQRYRTPIYRLLRQPVVAAILLTVLYAPLFLVSRSFETSGASLVVRVDYALTHLGSAVYAVGGELLLGGIVAQLISLAFPRRWGIQTPLQPSPVETSLQLRFFYGTGPLVLVLLLTLMVGDWVVAGNAARRMLEDRLSSTAQMASDSIPFFLESGQNLIFQQAADQRLFNSPVSQLPTLLHEDLTSVPYFRQLFIFDHQGQPVAGYPEAEFSRLTPSAEEVAGIQLALKGVSVQTYTVPPGKGEITARITFIAAVKDASGNIQGVILGRTDLATNPFTKPIIQAFEGMKDLGENGMILDESGRVLYYPISAWLMSTYHGKTSTDASFFDETAPDGTRNLVYYQPTPGRSWAIVLAVPAQRAQQMALDIAVPLLIMIIFIAILAFFSLRLGLRVVTGSLLTLAGEAGRISQGQLDHPLPAQGVDEVGRLRQAFEQMRLSLKARLEELNRLLLVSQGVASSLEMQDAVKPILEATLNGEVSAARVALVEQEDPDLQTDLPNRFGIGPANEQYAYLDDQILALCHSHPKLVLSNLTRGKGLNFPSVAARPAALMAFALRHETQYYGTLWVAYDRPRSFTEEEVRFVATLAGEAALAAANARLFASAEIGRQRLEAVLSATPDPVLVTDHQDRILLTNPAATHLFELGNTTVKGVLINQLINQRDLMEMLRVSSEEPLSRELNFANGRVYYVTVSSVAAEGQPVGKVCILHDITHFKEVDSLKSDFVATVSHDLRSPLTLMRGYATMLQMVGELNEQQRGYVRKIISGVESMSRLVNNLLDLGRIEAGVGLQVEIVPVVEIADRVVNSLQLQAAQKNIQLKAVYPPQPYPSIEADQALLQQALYNLVENGIKYTSLGGNVTVEVQSRPFGVLFLVRDNGIGIAPLDQPRLFEKFYRVGQRDGYQQRGSGLGLAEST